MELKDILPAVILIAATVIATSFIASVLTVMGANIDAIATSESTTFSTASAVSLTQDDLVAASETLTCNANNLVRDTDYTISDSAGTYLGISYPNFADGLTTNFTTNNDEAVTLTKTPRAEIGTDVVYNCSDDTQIFDNVTDYTWDYNGGTITALGTGTMDNDTVVCYNVTFGYAITGDTCSIAYSYNPNEDTLISKGNEAMSSFGNWWTILVVVLISVIAIGIVMKLKGRET